MSENIGSVSVEVVPDAEGFWRRFKEKTQGEAEKAGREAGEAVSRGIGGQGSAAGDEFVRQMRERLSAGLRDLPDARVGLDISAAERRLAELRAQIASGSSDIRVGASGSASSDVSAIGSAAARSTQQTNALRDAIVLLGAAVVPLAAVTGGAFLGLIPTVATLALGIKGITNELKSGELAGTRYGADIDTLKSHLSDLEHIASSGILAGVDQALQGSGPLFKALNGDISVMSTQLGNVVAGAGPALLSILHALNPLFVTFGNLVAAGAAKLEHWATSSTGISDFVAGVQAELPTVVHLLGSLVVTAEHLLVALAPLGHTILIGITALSDGISHIPVGVLSALLPILVGTYAAVRAYAFLTPVINGVSAAFAKFAAFGVASAASVEAATLAEQATVAQAAAAEATDRAALAASVAQSQAAIAESSLVVGTALEREAIIAAQTSAEEAAAFQAAAEAAILSSAEISAAAADAAVAVRASGARAAVGWTAMLGPIGAVAVGVGLLALTLGHSNKAAQEAAKDTNSYTSALITAKGAIDANVRSTAAKALADDGALAAAQKLGISASDATSALLGNAAAQGRVNIAIAEATGPLTASTKGIAGYSDKQKGAIEAAAKLQDGLNKQGAAFAAASVNAKLQLAAMEQTTGVTNAAATAAASLYNLHGTTGVTAYLAAKQAADKNIESTKKQTLAFQLENNAAGLVNQALQTMAGQNLSVAQAQTTLDSALLSMTATLKTNKGTLNEHTEAGIADRQAIEGAASATRAKLVADAASGTSTEAATATYRRNSAALLAQIGNLYGTTSAAYKYAASLLKIPPVVKTRADLDKEAAEKKANQIRGKLDLLKAQRTALLRLHDAGTARQLAQIQRQIDILTGHAQTVRINIAVNNSVGKAVHDAVATIKRDGGTIPGAASGWTVAGSGGPKSDSVLTRLSPGEEVTQNPMADKYRPTLKALNSDRPDLALAALVPAFAHRSGSTQARPVEASPGRTAPINNWEITQLPNEDAAALAERIMARQDFSLRSR